MEGALRAPTSHLWRRRQALTASMSSLAPRKEKSCPKRVSRRTRYDVSTAARRGPQHTIVFVHSGIIHPHHTGVHASPVSLYYSLRFEIVSPARLHWWIVIMLMIHLTSVFKKASLSDDTDNQGTERLPNVDRSVFRAQFLMDIRTQYKIVVKLVWLCRSQVDCTVERNICVGMECASTVPVFPISRPITAG